MEPMGSLDAPREGNVSVAQKQIFWNLMKSNTRNGELPRVRILAGPDHPRTALMSLISLQTAVANDCQ